MPDFQITNKTKLRDSVFGYSESAKQSEAEFLRLWRMAFRGLVQMGLMSFWQPKTISIKVNGNKTATFPGDYMTWVGIGTFNQGGEFQTLAINENLTLFKDNSSERTDLIQPETIPMADYIIDNSFTGINGYNSESFGAGGAYGPRFGLGSRLLQPGQCKVDEDNRCIVLGTDFTLDHVALKYIPSPEKDDDYTIPIQFNEAMIAWLGWKDIEHLPNRAREVPMRASAFAAQLKLAKKLFEPFRAQIANQYFREAQKLAVKG